MSPMIPELDVLQFQHHYNKALHSMARRAGQRLFNTWYFYISPCLIGIAPGELLAKRFLDWQGQPEIYGLCLFGGALIITPLLLRYRRLHKSHKRYQLFYNAALEACFQEK
jgi:ABC-type cobalamin transport system permease subunit